MLFFLGSSNLLFLSLSLCCASSHLFSSRRRRRCWNSSVAYPFNCGTENSTFATTEEFLHPPATQSVYAIAASPGHNRLNMALTSHSSSSKLSLASLLAFFVSISSLVSAHTVITYPGWRGDNLHSNGTDQNFIDGGGLGVGPNNSFPYGMQWMYPCKTPRALLHDPSSRYPTNMSKAVECL